MTNLSNRDILFVRISYLLHILTTFVLKKDTRKKDKGEKTD